MLKISFACIIKVDTTHIGGKMCDKTEEVILPTEIIVKSDEAITAEELAMANISLSSIEEHVNDIVEF